MDGRRAGRVVEWRVAGCLPTMLALVAVAASVAIAVAFGAMIVAAVLALAAVLYVARAVRRLAGGRRRAVPDDGQPWRELGRTPLPPPEPPRSEPR